MDSRTFSNTLIDLGIVQATEWRIFGELQTTDNTLTDSDISALLAFIILKQPRTLQLFNLGLIDEQVIPILQDLTTNTSITCLDLTLNRITDKSANAIAELLKKNKTIKELILTSNKLTNEGIQTIAMALIVNSTLNSLDIICNQHTNEIIRPFEGAITANYQINSIKFFPKKIEEAQQEELAGVMKILDRNAAHQHQTDERLTALSLFCKNHKNAVRLDKTTVADHEANADNKNKLSKIGKKDRLPKYH
jgi:hypothetical protein